MDVGAESGISRHTEARKWACDSASSKDRVCLSFSEFGLQLCLHRVVQYVGDRGTHGERNNSLLAMAADWGLWAAQSSGTQQISTNHRHATPRPTPAPAMQEIAIAEQIVCLSKLRRKFMRHYGGLSGDDTSGGRTCSTDVLTTVTNSIFCSSQFTVVDPCLCARFVSDCCCGHHDDSGKTGEAGRAQSHIDRRARTCTTVTPSLNAATLQHCNAATLQTARMHADRRRRRSPPVPVEQVISICARLCIHVPVRCSIQLVPVAAIATIVV